MYLIEALHKKEALSSLLEDKINDIHLYLNDSNKLSEALLYIDSIISEIFSLEKSIQVLYSSTYVTNTETIEDVLRYIEELDKKITVLKDLHILVLKKKIEVPENNIDIDVSVLFESIEVYSSLIDELKNKVKTICTKTEL